MGTFVPDTRLRIGIFGGTFDPVHIGHITLAEEIKQHLQIDQMHLLPCRLPPHRKIPGASNEDRLQMLRLAIADTSLLIDQRELERDGPSYTFDTLQSLRHQYGAETSIVFCMGMDAFAHFDTWHRWQEILSLAHLAIIARANQNPTLNENIHAMLANCQCKDISTLKNTPAGNIYLTQLSQIPVSSTRVRQQLAQRTLSPDTLKPAVYRYIDERGLYLTP
jgi:nicotinate-nucleotide adenylyltransferase